MYYHIYIPCSSHIPDLFRFNPSWPRCSSSLPMRWPSLRWPLHNGTSEAIWKRLQNHGISWGGHMVKPWLTWVSYILAIENDQKPWFYHMILGGRRPKDHYFSYRKWPKKYHINMVDLAMNSCDFPVRYLLFAMGNHRLYGCNGWLSMI